jgi:hypothetical protein
MRLSVGIVFLIGAMVATEVTCDTADMVANVRTWFEETLKRLEMGQTLKDNRPFLDFTIGNVNHVLGLLSCTRSVDFQINSRETDIPFDNLLLGQIKEIQNELRPRDDRAALHIGYLLEAINHVLLGNLGSARVAIDASTRDLPFTAPSSDDPRVASNRISSSMLPLGVTFGRPIPTYFNDGTLEQTAIFRAWLSPRLSGSRLEDYHWLAKMLHCVGEITQALVNWVESPYLPREQSKFIGRYPIVRTEEIALRIQHLEHNMTPDDATETNGISLRVVVLKSVLQAVMHMFNYDFKKAKEVIDNSIENNRYRFTDPNRRGLFRAYVLVTYGVY